MYYPCNGTAVLTDYSDSGHARDFGDRKSSFGYIFILSECDISSKSIKQTTVDISSFEAENILKLRRNWLKELLEQIRFPQNEVTTCEDNLSIMQIKNGSFIIDQNIDVHSHFIRYHYQQGTLGLQYI